MKKENMNNKGFSLVELIIVIAIMAILIVVLAPQYLKYVERSRNSTDLQNATEIKVAIETWAADPQASSHFTTGDTFTVEIRSGGGSCSNTVVGDALTDAGLTLGDIKCSSRSRWSQYDMEGTYQANGAINWVYTSDNGNAFDAAMKGNT